MSKNVIMTYFQHNNQDLTSYEKLIKIRWPW